MTQSRTLLSVRSLSQSFSGLKALQNASFDIPQGTIVGLIGPNGAGKTTLLNCLTRIYTPDSGSVIFDGRDLLRQPLHQIVEMGIARTFQNLQLFSAETALENVMVGAFAALKTGFLTDLLGFRSSRLVVEEARHEAHAQLKRQGLESIEGRTVATLPYGVQKRIELARALATKPRLLLLDEPAAGLNPDETGALAHFILKLKAAGLTVVLVEHDMRLVMGICDTLIVLDHGELIASGTPVDVRSDEQVIKAYLGEDTADAA
jgi:branched-chain amino acid transport system ATP-binding protein